MARLFAETACTQFRDAQLWDSFSRSGLMRTVTCRHAAVAEDRLLGNAINQVGWLALCLS